MRSTPMRNVQCAGARVIVKLAQGPFSELENGVGVIHVDSNGDCVLYILSSSVF